MPRRIDITGRSFGRWTVLSYARNKRWLAKCACGEIREVAGDALRDGRSLSCGCLWKEIILTTITKHGCSTRAQRTREYSSWRAMNARCNAKPGSRYYRLYVSRGIKVCERWKHSFVNFLADMGPRPKAKSLDRIDNNGNYDPKNCRWATQKQQMQNTRVYKGIV